MDPESHPAAAQHLSSDALDDCVLEAVVHCAVVEGDEASWLTLHAISEHAPDKEFADRYPRAHKYIDWPMLLVMQFK